MTSHFSRRHDPTPGFAERRAPFRAAAIAAALLFAVAALSAPAQQFPQPAGPAAPPAQDQRQAPPSGPPGGITLGPDKTPLSIVLTLLSTTANVQVVAKGRVNPSEQISFISKGDPINIVLEKIIGPRDWVWRYNESGGVYEIWDKPTYETTVLAGLMIDKTFSVRYIKASDALSSLQPLINADKGGSIAVDERTQKIFVRDLPEVVQEIARLLEELDVNLVTRVFRIQHADVEELAEKMAVHKTEPGTIDVDQRTHQIIVTDLEQNIRRMELVVETLDVGPEARVYDIYNIGFEGTDVEELRSAIERVITPDAFFEIIYQAGTLYLEDVPEVHERVELLLDAFDPPPKQVMIEAEIVETNFNRSLNYGTQYTFSEDLFAATLDGLLGTTVPLGATMSPDNPLGFSNFREELPLINLGSDGSFGVSNLSSKALVSLQASLTDTDTQILLQPRLLVKNHETATIQVGGEEPISNPVFNDQGVIISTTRSTVREGLFLELRPSISNSGLIEIEVQFENDDAEQAGADGSGNPLVRRSTQQVDTVFIIPSAETRVIGGLLVNSKSDTDRGIPFLVDIPWIGPLLFGNKENINNQRHIMIFITPTIIEEKPRSSRVRYRPFTREDARNLRSGDKNPEDEEEAPHRRGVLADEYKDKTAKEEPPSLTEEAPADSEMDDGSLPEDYMAGEGIPEVNLNDLGIQFDESGKPIDPGALQPPGPGPEASGLIREGSLMNDPAMRDTVSNVEDPNEAIDPVVSSYAVQVGAPGSNAGGGRTPSRPGVAGRPGTPGSPAPIRPVSQPNPNAIPGGNTPIREVSRDPRVAPAPETDPRRQPGGGALPGNETPFQ